MASPDDSPWSPSGPATTSLQTMNPATHAITAVGSVPQPILDLSVLPSGSLNEAFGWTSTGFVRFATDPTTSIVSIPVRSRHPRASSPSGVS